MEKLKDIRYIKKGVNLDILRSGKEGIWFYRIGFGRTIDFLQFELNDKSEENVKKLLGIMQYIFPFGEIIGRNTQKRCFLTLKLKRFSTWQQNAARQKLMDLFPKRDIYNVRIHQA